MTSRSQLGREAGILETLEYARAKTGRRALGRSIERQIIDGALRMVRIDTYLDECDRKIAELCQQTGK